MNGHELEAFRIGLIIGVACGATLGALLTYVLVRGKKPKTMATGNPYYFSSQQIR